MNKIEIHKSLCDQLNDIYSRKNADYGDLSIRDFHATYGPEGCDKWWENTPSYYPEAVAFRALPEKYVE